MSAPMPLSMGFAQSLARTGGRLRASLSLPDGDLPSLTDPRLTMPRFVAILVAVAVPIILVTAPGELGPGERYGAVASLSIGLALLTAGLVLLPWRDIGGHWLIALVAVPIAIVGAIGAVTGAGGSAYFALYAPLLAIAGWFLPPLQVAGAIGLVGTNELWRAMVVDSSGSIEQVVIALPFYAAVAIVGMITSRRLTRAIALLRVSQVRTAATMNAVARIRSERGTDPLQLLREEATRVFDADARLIRAGSGVVATWESVPAVHDGTVRVAIQCMGGVAGALELRRAIPFTTNELRLLCLLADTTGVANDAHALGWGEPGKEAREPRRDD